MPKFLERNRLLVFEGLFLALVAVACRPLWLTAWLPMQDLPQHLAAIRVLHDYSQAGLGFQNWFELTPMSTQYIGFYLLASLLSFVFEVEAATRILIVVSVAALPYAMRFLLRKLERPEWLALFVIPLAYNTNFILGFLNFIAALPLMVLGLALALGLREAVTWRRALGYAAAASACFLMHVLPFGILLIGTVLIAASRDWRTFGRRLAPLVPVFIVAGVWSLLSEAGGSIWQILKNSALRLSGTPEPQASFVGWDQALRQIPDWLLDVVKVPGEDLVTIGLVAMVALCFLLASARRFRPDLRPDELGESAGEQWGAWCLVVLVAASWALYFLLPQGYDWVWPIAPRFALIAAILTVPLIPAVERPVARAVFVVALAALIIAQASLIGRSFEAFQRDEVADFAQAVDAIPQGQRVAGLIFDRGSEYVRFSPFIHSVAHVQSQKGGAVMFTFADFPQSPFRFRPENRPPQVQPRWEWTPQNVDPRGDLAWYNYILIRGGPGKVARQTDAYHRVYSGQRWSVWERVAGNP